MMSILTTKMQPLQTKNINKNQVDLKQGGLFLLVAPVISGKCRSREVFQTDVPNRRQISSQVGGVLRLHQLLCCFGFEWLCTLVFSVLIS